MPPIIIAMTMLALVIIVLGALAYSGYRLFQTTFEKREPAPYHHPYSKKVTVYTTVMGVRMKCTFDENGGESWSRV
jgi:hypothetical protein